jgi:hypothetical protein
MIARLHLFALLAAKVYRGKRCAACTKSRQYDPNMDPVGN